MGTLPKNSPCFAPYAIIRDSRFNNVAGPGTNFDTINGERHPFYLWFRFPEAIFNPQGGLDYPARNVATVATPSNNKYIYEPEDKQWWDYLGAAAVVTQAAWNKQLHEVSVTVEEAESDGTTYYYDCKVVSMNDMIEAKKKIDGMIEEAENKGAEIGDTVKAGLAFFDWLSVWGYDTTFATYEGGLVDVLIPYRAWSNDEISTGAKTCTTIGKIVALPLGIIAKAGQLVLYAIHDVIKIPVIPVAGIYYAVNGGGEEEAQNKKSSDQRKVVIITKRIITKKAQKSKNSKEL